MNSERSSQSGLSLRLSVIGVPVYTINPFVDLLCKWSRCSGDEWTVKRCKSLKLTLIQLRSGIQPTISLAKNRKGQIKGVIGSLLRWGLKSDKNFFKVLNAFMAYTNWSSSKLTDEQKKKFLQAVHAKPVAIPVTFAHHFELVVKATIPRRIVHEVPKPLIFFRGSATKHAPNPLGGSVSQDEKVLIESFLSNNTQTMDHINSLWHRVYSNVFKGIDIRRFCESAHEDEIDNGPMVAGEVHFIQEPGYKCRSIASPYRLFQVASLPLQKDLGRLVQSLEWDCTHEQGKATPFIKKALLSNHNVYSVDLSSATDYFPFELQMMVLETIYGKEDSYIKFSETCLGQTGSQNLVL